MTLNSLEKEFPQEMIFIKESTKELVLMSDEQEVFCYHSLKRNEEGKPVIFFIRGAGPGIYSWTDFWDELHKYFDMVIIDSREKPSIDLKKRKQCSVHRIALDIVEIIHYLKIKEEDVVFIGSSFGVHYVAHCLGQKWLNPRSCLFIGPALQSDYPKFKTGLAFLLPTFLLEKIGKKIAVRYVRNRVEEGFQKKVYLERVNSIDVGRWKRCKKMRFRDSSEDYKKITCPVYIFETSDDKYHKTEGIHSVSRLIKDSQLINLPNYNYMHIKPGVVEFSEMIKNLLDKTG